jgi:hypothetical protein
LIPGNQLLLAQFTIPLLNTNMGVRYMSTFQLWDQLIMLDIISQLSKIYQQIPITNLPSLLKRDQRLRGFSSRQLSEHTKLKYRLNTILHLLTIKIKLITSMFMDLISLLFSSIALSQYPERIISSW